MKKLIVFIFLFIVVFSSIAIEIINEKYRIVEKKELNLKTVYTGFYFKDEVRPLIRGKLFWFPDSFVIVFDAYHYLSYPALSFTNSVSINNDVINKLTPSKFKSKSGNYFQYEKELENVTFYRHSVYNSHSKSYFFFGGTNQADRLGLYQILDKEKEVKKIEYYRADGSQLFQEDKRHEENYIATNIDHLSSTNNFLFFTYDWGTEIFKIDNDRAVKTNSFKLSTVFYREKILNTTAVNERCYYLWDCDYARDPGNLTNYFFIEVQSDKIQAQSVWDNKIQQYSYLVSDKHAIYYLNSNVLYRNNTPIARAAFFDHLYSYGDVVICGNSLQFIVIKDQKITQYFNTGNERIYLDNCAFYDNYIVTYRNEGVAGYLYLYDFEGKKIEIGNK